MAKATGSSPANGKWSIGLVNSQNLYLSAEKFQFKVNASGKTMKMKQIWTMEKIDEDKVVFKSWLERYLGCNKDGVISAVAEEVGPDNIFCFVHQGNGRFEIRSSQGHALCGSHDSIAGRLRETNPEGWCIHLAIVPQINLRNIQRKAFARISAAGDQFEVKNEIPWGQNCILLLQYKEGRYCFQDLNHKFLSSDGTLKAECGDDTLFVLFFKQNSIAFCDFQGKYLSCVGPQAVLRSSRKDGIGQSELFEIHNAKPQVTLQAFNQKYFSNRQGTDVRANQFDVENTEIFQIEAVDPDDTSGNVKWSFLASNKKYWTTDGNSLASSDEDGSKSEMSHFEIVWKNNKVALKCSNGKFLNARSGGQISPSGSNEDEESCQFVMQMVNRPLIAFNGCYGFIGVKGASGILECNRSQAEFFQLINEESSFAIQCNGRYWNLAQDDTVAATSDSPTYFFIEFRAHNKVCIVAPNGQYLRGSQNGSFTASGGRKVESTTLYTI